MQNFFTEIDTRLTAISNLASMAAMASRTKDAEGCAVYEDLLALKTLIDAAVDFYASDVPAVSREDISGRT